MLVEDTTGKLLVYAGSAVSANVGDVVKVEGSMATYGGLRQVGSPTVTVTGSTTYTYPTAEVMDGAAMDAYLSNPVVKYVEYTGTLAISGYYYNVTVDGAATAVGSLAYVIDGTVDPALDGQKILVKGWTIGFSGGKYVNTMISEVTAAGVTEPEEPGDDPVSPEGWAGRDDFNTIGWNSSYIARESTAGWVGENCAVQSGGASDANPVFNSMLGSDENTRAWVINGKTSAVGKITSPVISTGCGTLTFNYSMAFTEKNGYDFNVDIMQNGEVVKTYNVVNADNTKYAKFTFSEEVNVAGDFQIVITNNCPSATDGNKDRYSIWDVMWTAYN